MNNLITLAIYFFLIYFHFVASKVTDTLCGTKILFKRLVEDQKILWNLGTKIDGVILTYYLAQQNFLKIAEIPVNYKERTEEKSKMTNLFSNGLRMLFISIISFFKLRF